MTIGAKTAIYARGSGRQSDFSLQLQVSRAEALAERMGLNQLAVYTDKADGAAVHDSALYARPGLARLREACERREISIILTASPDRLSRDPAELAQIRAWADGQRVRLIFVTEQIR